MSTTNSTASQSPLFPVVNTQTITGGQLGYPYNVSGLLPNIPLPFDVTIVSHKWVKLTLGPVQATEGIILVDAKTGQEVKVTMKELALQYGITW